VELREAAQRLLWHYKLLLICTSIGLLVPFALSQQKAPMYQASMRMLVSGGAADAPVTADTVAAIATSPTLLAEAFANVGADRNAHSAIDDVSVRSVGGSGAIDLAITDKDPVVAAAVANSLTVIIVRVMHESNLVKFPLPDVIHDAGPSTTTQVAPTRLQDIVFGGLLGLVLGLVAAALLEAYNPTVIGKQAIAAELRAPVLAVLPNVKATPNMRDLPWLRWQLGAQATRSGVGTVELTAAGPPLDLEPLSLALLDSTPPANGSAAGRSRSRRRKANSGSTVTIESSTNGHTDEHVTNGTSGSGLKIRVLDRTDQLSFHANGSAGIVVVVPTVVKRTDMDSAKDLLSLTGWPAVGVIAYRRGPLASSLGRLSAKSRPARVRSN
jgi:capsular polysaccharide biosynthesis protein